MSGANNTSPSRNHKRLWCIVFFVTALGVFGGITFYYQIPDPPKTFSESEKELVGVWRFQDDDAYELHPDRTCTRYFYGPYRKKMFSRNGDMIWWREGDRLTVRHINQASYSVLGVWNLKGHCADVWELTPDGPNQFKYSKFWENEFRPVQTLGSGTMKKIDRPIAEPFP